MDGNDDTPRVEEATLDQITAFFRRQDLAHLVFARARPGALVLAVCVEWYWYAPGTPRNRFFHLRLLEWEGMDWAAASFPQPRLPAARRLAKQLGMRLADGVPTLLARGPAAAASASARPSSAAIREAGLEARFFPGAGLADGGDNRAMWQVENDPASPVYLNRRRIDEDVFAAEDEIARVFANGHRPTPREVADYVWGDAALRFGR